VDFPEEQVLLLLHIAIHGLSSRYLLWFDGLLVVICFRAVFGTAVLSLLFGCEFRAAPFTFVFAVLPRFGASCLMAFHTINIKYFAGFAHGVPSLFRFDGSRTRFALLGSSETLTRRGFQVTALCPRLYV
jgi:hypothetical protein